jgi:hypothetical protein
MTEFKEPVFYVPGTTIIIDEAVNRAGVLVGHYSEKPSNKYDYVIPAPPWANRPTYMQKPKRLSKQNRLKSRKTNF